jgi:membrane-associated protease RseP (regulator of RpoE activity)
MKRHIGKLAALGALCALVGTAPLAAKPAEAAPDERAKLEKELAEARATQRDVAERVRELQRRLGKQRSERLLADRLLALDDLRGVGRARLGVTIDDDARDEEGARIAAVSPGGPAADAGLRAGDLIVELEGKPLKAGGGESAFDKLRHAMHDLEPGAKVKLKAKRDGKPQEFTVTTEAFGAGGFAFAFGDDDAPGFAELWMPRAMPVPAPRPGVQPRPFVYQFSRTWGDLEMVSLSERLGGYFGAKAGVLVVRAPGEAGLKLEDGDVIVKVGDREVTSPEQAMRILRSYGAGETLKLEVLRDKKRVTLDVTVPERRVGLLGEPMPDGDVETLIERDIRRLVAPD